MLICPTRSSRLGENQAGDIDWISVNCPAGYREELRSSYERARLSFGAPDILPTSWHLLDPYAVRRSAKCGDERLRSRSGFDTAVPI